MAEQQIRFERPTVLIGLGGTGKQSLLYLRRMFFERYGVKTLPHVAQVVIDTDGREENLDGTEYDEFAREVAFDDELVVTPLSQALRNYRENRAQYPHIDSWFDRALENHGEITDGAGQIRAMGRLAFFHHHNRIRDRLTQAYKTVTDRASHDEALKRFNIQIKPDGQGVETWMIFSVAGGTGSGMFLDAAFLAKQVARGFGGGEARSVILLPTAFSTDLPQHISDSDKHRLFANAYAALTELETYNYTRPSEAASTRSPDDAPIKRDARFHVQWTREQQSQKITETGPVFVNSWLIDNEPAGGGGQVHGERMSLCQMIAEWLFIQYGATQPALSGQIVSNRSNDVNRLAPAANVNIAYNDGAGRATSEEDLDPDDKPVTLLYSRRYSSFGLSKIYVPTTNLASQAYARLVGDLARLWLVEEATGDVRRSGLSRLYPTIHMPAKPQINGFTDTLARRLAADGGKQPLSRRFEQLIQDQFLKLKGAGFEAGAETEAREWFEREVTTKLLDGSSAALGRRGEISSKVQVENSVAAAEEIRAGFHAFLDSTLKTPGERLPFADEALRLAAKDFEQAKAEAEQKAQREERRGNRLQTELEELLVWSNDHRGFDRATLFQAAFDKMKQRATAEFRRQVFLALAKVAGDTVNFIGVGNTVKDENGNERVVYTGLLSSVAMLRSTLDALILRSGQRIQALRQQPVSSLNSRAPAADTDDVVDAETELASIYKDKNGQAIGPEEVTLYEEQLYLALGQKGFTSPWFLRERTDAGDVEDTFEAMLVFASRQLSHLPGRMQDALLRFDQKFRRNEVKGQYDAELDRVIGRGAPWLPSPEHNMGGDETYRDQGAFWSKRYATIAPAAADAPSRVLKDKLKRTEIVSGALDTVYFESEVAGIPLFAVRRMDLYRNAYLGYLDSADSATRVVHTELDLEKYPDLLPYTAEELRLRLRATKTFIRAMVCGVLKPDPAIRGVRPHWCFEESKSTAARPILRPLGSYVAAIRVLSRAGSALHAALAREVEARYADRVTHDDLGRIYYAIEEMQVEPPIESSEWNAAARSVLKAMRDKYGPAVSKQATEAKVSFVNWAEAVPSGAEKSFWRLKSLATVG